MQHNTLHFKRTRELIAIEQSKLELSLKMPFYKRIVEPRSLCRFNREGLDVDAGVFNGDLFPSMDAVNCKTLIYILHQLTDLSQHASSIFVEIHTEAALVINKASALQHRLDSLQETVLQLDHKRIRIRNVGHLESCLNLPFKSGFKEISWLWSWEMWGERSFLRYRGESHPVPRALCALGLSSLTEQHGRFFPCHREQDTDDDFDEWVYAPLHRRAVSSLDEESKWSVHYTAHWHQQENVFLPETRPACVEDLHRQAKVNLKTVLRECDKLRKDGFHSSQYYSPSPAFSSASLCESVHLDEEKTEKKKKDSESATEEEKLVYSMPPQTPLLEHASDMNIQSRWTDCVPLPTPEEKMRLQAQSVATAIIPINITGENFDRQASFRRSAANTDTIIRRPKRVQRRKTITGVPDNIQAELANKGQADSRIHSMCVADQYSTLSRVGSVTSTLRCSDAHDSSCQTEEINIVPPSVRRIKAQRGHGIAAQMANISHSATSSISTMSECNGITYTQLNGSDQSFNSLPQQCSHISHQNCELKYSSSPYRINSSSTSSLPYQLDMNHGSSASLHMLSDTWNNALNSNTAEDFSSLQNDQFVKNPNCQGSNQNRPTFFSGALQNSAEFNSILSEHNRIEENHMQLPPSSAQLFSSSDVLSAVSSCYESTASLCSGIHTETDSQCSTLDGRNCSSPNSLRRDSNFSESSIQSCSTLTTDQWTYEASPKGGPISNSSCSSFDTNSHDHSPSKTDASSLCSVDNEGYYTSMHMDSGLKSHSHGCINKAGNVKQSLYEYKGHRCHSDHESLHSNRSLTRSISLRKAKKPPLPPARTDSLRCKPHRKPHHSGKVLSEQLISSLQQSLELNLKTHSASFSGQAPCSGFEDPWVLRPRSQSTVSVASSGMSAPAAVCPVTPTQSDNCSQCSDYAESWDFYMDYSSTWSEQGLSSQNTRSGSADENSGVMSNGSYNSGSYNNGYPLAYCNGSGMKSKLVSSPDKVHRLTSPSSGYSSQNNTPAGTPVTSLIRAKSPAGRPKPKVPERKSSLRSSVSSSSTSLSSNTSDSFKNLPPPPPLPDITTSQCVTPSFPSSSLIAAIIDPIPPLYPLPEVSSASEERQNSHSHKECETLLSDSLDFPPPPSNVYKYLSLLPPKPSSCILLPLPPPPPPLPEMSLQTTAILKTESSSKPTEAEEIEKGLNLNLTGESEPKLQRPKITAQALQMVQLRPVKLKKIENIFITVRVQHFEDQAQNESQTCSRKSRENETTEQTVTANCVSQPENGVNTSKSSIQNLSQASFSSLPLGQDECINTETEQNVPVLVHISDSVSTHPVLTFQEIPQCTDSSSASQGTPLKQKPPISHKKPYLSLNIPPIMHLPVSNRLKLQQSNETAVTPEPRPMNGLSLTETVNFQEIPLGLEEESDSDTSTPVIKSKMSISSELSSSSLQDLQLSALIHESDLGLSDKGLGLSDDKIPSDDGLSCSSGSISFIEEENEENVAEFDSSTEISSGIDTNGEAVEEMVTPVRPRTTGDLFAAIHRSKRKVLGRGDSDEHCRSRLPSPPVTPTGSCPSIPSLPRQSGSIQRNLRRSSTSNDSFKALLLKKGSRSESSFRMSAAEILKCTDPRFQRANSEPAHPDGMCTSPRSRRAHEEWARIEGGLPRLSTGLTSLKYGRSRTPPSAASSRYNSRSRIPSGPMTAICEREGEVAESTDCCISVESHFTLSTSSSGTVCAQGST
ncbi:NHS-like protein 1 [Xyrauchen texanus]|uniref:NHS-like protein 1 n=1 Tax=Xyrauchen texanus TaxID=154827 RepID=UPI0022420446|nr:NHS-like protein 1 [Xyrauchen texanus]